MTMTSLLGHLNDPIISKPETKAFYHIVAEYLFEQSISPT